MYQLVRVKDMVFEGRLIQEVAVKDNPYESKQLKKKEKRMWVS